MKKINRILIFMLTLLFTLAVFALTACDEPKEKPLPEKEQTESGTPSTAPKTEIFEFISRVYDATANNFTLTLRSRGEVDGEESDLETATLVYDLSSGWKLTEKDREIIYSDGMIYSCSIDELGVKSAYTAREAEETELLGVMDDALIGDALNTVLYYSGMDGAAETVGDNFVYSLTTDEAETLGTLFGIISDDVDESVLKTATDLLNAALGTQFTPDVLEEIFVYYADTDLNTMLERGEPINNIEFRIYYAYIRNTVKDSYALPSCDEFLRRYGDKSLGELFSFVGADFMKKCKTTKLREVLERIPYMDATLADFADACGGTEVESAQTELVVTANKNYELVSVNLDSVIKMNSAPIFSATLEESGVKRKIMNISVKRSVSGVFTDVGTSTVTPPEDYVVVGEKTVSLHGSGSYKFRFGSLNTPYSDVRNQTAASGEDKSQTAHVNVATPSVDIESTPIPEENRKEWLDAVKAVTSGIVVDYEHSVVIVSETAYAGMLKAREMGLTGLKVRAFDELTFVLDF